ncbi:MAG TPA: hypothetical protein VJR94_02725, partial [Candidatus Nitrosocosmicus sp.]|nr:hypothetical protein [Candidatus Nitrosocosmicus sp.]
SQTDLGGYKKLSDRLDLTTVNKPKEGAYKEICNSFDCNNLATEEVKLSAGEFGIVTIHICEDCKHIFEKN